MYRNNNASSNLSTGTAALNTEADVLYDSRLHTLASDDQYNNDDLKEALNLQLFNEDSSFIKLPPSVRPNQRRSNSQSEENNEDYVIDLDSDDSDLKHEQ